MLASKITTLSFLVLLNVNVTPLKAEDIGVMQSINIVQTPSSGEALQIEIREYGGETERKTIPFDNFFNVNGKRLTPESAREFWGEIQKAFSKLKDGGKVFHSEFHSEVTLNGKTVLETIMVIEFSGTEGDTFMILYCRGGK